MESEVRIGEWTVIPNRRLLVRQEEKHQITPKALGVLMRLVEADGDTVSRDALFDAVWPGGSVTDDTLTGCIFELRKAFGDSARDPKFIETIPKTGFRLLPKAVISTDSEPRVSDNPVPLSRSRGRWRTAVLLLASLLIIAAVLYPTLLPSKFTVAVLPFDVIGDSPALETLSQSLHEELIDQLAGGQFCYWNTCMPMQVTSRTDTLFAAQENLSVANIAESLGVNFVVEGSIRELNGELRITTQLIRPSDGFHIWSKTYERSSGLDFAQQTRLAKRIANLSIRLITHDSLQQWVQRFSLLAGMHLTIPHPETFDVIKEWTLYSAGEGGSPTTIVALTKKAVAANPDDAQALWWLAQSYDAKFYTDISPEEAAREAHRALDAAESLEPDHLLIRMLRLSVQQSLELNLAAADMGWQKLAEEKPLWPLPNIHRASIAALEGRASDSRKLLEFASRQSGVQEGDVQRFGEALLWFFLDEPARCLAIVETVLDTVDSGAVQQGALYLKGHALLALRREQDLGRLQDNPVFQEVRPLDRAVIAAARGQRVEAMRLFTLYQRTKSHETNGISLNLAA